MVSLGCRVVELARFVSILSLFINSVLSSMAKLPQGQVSLGSGTRFSWCCGGLFPSRPLLQADVGLPQQRLQVPQAAVACGEAFAFLAPAGAGWSEAAA